MCPAGADSSSVWVCETFCSLIGATTLVSATARQSKCRRNHRLSSHPHPNNPEEERVSSEAVLYARIVELFETDDRGSSAPWANQRHMHEEKRHECNVCVAFMAVCRP